MAREDDEPALPDSITTEQNLASAEMPPNTTTPQVVEQNSESNIEVDSENSESTTLPVAEQMLETRENVVPEPGAVESQDNLTITQSMETKVDTQDESSELPNSGADPTKSNNGDQTKGEQDDFSEKTSKSVSRSEDATNTQGNARNVSIEETSEAKRTDQIEREQVLGDVKTHSSQSQENSDDSHDEL